MADNAIFGVTIADVAQLDRAFGYEPKGSRFESWHPQKGKTSLCDLSFLVFACFFEGEGLPLASAAGASSATPSNGEGPVSPSNVIRGNAPDSGREVIFELQKIPAYNNKLDLERGNTTWGLE